MIKTVLLLESAALRVGEDIPTEEELPILTLGKAYKAYKLGNKVYNIHLDWSKATEEPK